MDGDIRYAGDLTDDQKDWLEDALYELKGLRGWAWDGDDIRIYRELVGE